MRALGGIALAAALAAAAPASAQDGWPEAPMIIGVGFNNCRDVLSVPADARRDAMVSQWALGFYSGLATAGGESDSAQLRGLDSALKRFLRTSPDIRVTLNERIIAHCTAQPDTHLAQTAWNVLEEIINEDTE